LRNAIVRHIEHSHRNGFAVIGKNARHADLASDKAQTHFILLYPVAIDRDLLTTNSFRNNHMANVPAAMQIITAA
jgi:hypothetical protein